MKYLAATRRKALTTATVISFSLTFLLGDLAILLGLLPSDLRAVESALGRIDTGVVLLLVPVIALIAAMVVEATRLALRGPVVIDEARPVGPLTDWKPGNGEG